MTISLIAAVALNGAIGRGNALMWHISGDMKYFRTVTYGCPVIMGRRTFESIGRPLPGRLNIVLSRGDVALPEGMALAHDMEEASALAEAYAAEHPDVRGEAFIIGGSQIYSEGMKKASKLYITRVFTAPDDADAFFPDIDTSCWKLVSQSETETDAESGLKYCFEIYGQESD